METDIILISDTEETKNCDGNQQCNEVEVIEIPDDSDVKENSDSKCTVTSNEPIDLTVNKPTFPGREERFSISRNNSQVTIKQNKNCSFQYPRTLPVNPTKPTSLEPTNWPRVVNNCNTTQAHNNYRNIYYNKKPNLPYSHVGSPYTNFSRNSALTIPMKKQNVLKTAKSLFSKRTRTLYHWMYPNSTAQQIKEAVNRTWESMSFQEKNIYVSQVLARPGSSNTNLMVNPQLGQIQALQPQSRCSVNHFNPKSTELQNAISSISSETNDFSSSSSTEPDIMTNKPSHYFTSTNQEFDDDPELNKELVQFSLTFKN